MWRSYIRRNCRYFSFRASVSGLGFGPRVSRLHHLVASSTSSTPLCVLQSCTIALNCTTFELRSFIMFKILFICECNTKPKYLLQKHGGVPHGPRPETEARNDRIVAKIRTPFRASERAPFPTPRIFATILIVSGLGANSF